MSTGFEITLGMHAGPRGRSAPRQGFTLLETVLALTLMILVVSGVFGFYWTVLKTRNEGSMIARDAMVARAILERMAEEIRHAVDIVPGDGIGFRGTQDSITIVCSRLPETYSFNIYDPAREKPPPGQMDLVRIQYQLVWDSENEDDEGVKLCHGLLRTIQKLLDPNPKFVVKVDAPEDVQEDQPGPAAPPIEPELVAPEIKYLKFEYFDGAEWKDRWHVPYEKPSANPSAAASADGTENTESEAVDPDPGVPGKGNYALPQAIRITVGKVRVAPDDEKFDITILEKSEQRRTEEESHPDRFTLVVHLLQADPTLLSSRKHGMINNPDLQTGGGESR